MMKPQENLGEEWNNNDITSKVNQEAMAFRNSIIQY